MSPFELRLLRVTVIATAILLFLGVLFGILFLFKWMRRNRSLEPRMPCYYHSFTFLSSLMNIVITSVAFVYCFWSWRSISDDNNDEEAEGSAFKLFAACEFVWHLSKILDLFIFNAKLKYTFINTSHATKKCLTAALQIMAFVFIIPILFRVIVPLTLDGTAVSPSALKLFRLLRLFRVMSPLLYFIDLVLVTCVYGRKYRFIARAISSMPMIQQDDVDRVNLNDLTKYSMLTAMACKGGVFVWLCMFACPILISMPESRVAYAALIATVISLDGFLDTLSILMLYPFGASIYNVCCMFNRGGRARTCSFHNCWDCFVRCTCCVPNTARVKIPDTDTYIDI
eukprot:183348_1